MYSKTDILVLVIFGLQASPDNFDALRGLTNVLLAAKKPEEVCSDVIRIA